MEGGGKQGAPEVDKDALGGLRAQVADLVTAGADGGTEHEIEGEGLGDVVVGVGGLDPILGKLLAQFFCRQLIQPTQEVPHLLFANRLSESNVSDAKFINMLQMHSAAQDGEGRSNKVTIDQHLLSRKQQQKNIAACKIWDVFKIFH